MIMEEERQKLKEKYEKNEFDYQNPDACEVSPLWFFDIPEINRSESKKYGTFKVVRREAVDTYVEYEMNREIYDSILLYYEGEWIDVKHHTIYRKELEPEHGKAYESGNEPLIPIIYVDIEYFFFYIENEEGILYFSADKLNWFSYNIQPEKRPYYNRIDKLRKFKIPYETGGTEDYIV